MRKCVLAFFLLTSSITHAQTPEGSWTERWTSPEMLIGAGFFLAGYGGTVLYGTQSNNDYSGTLYIPLVGPWIELFDLPDCGEDIDCAYDSEDRVALILGGLGQAAGIGLMTYALVRHREPGPIQIAPSYSGGAAGFKVSGKF